ncbi:MAG: tetratricopeptide repeat protein, partial [Fimbriimonadaceae bacterium]|nr:tetratricopeptide repeat protein [Alphaproteobacteria bacterium]
MPMNRRVGQKGRLDMLRQQAGLQYRSGQLATALDIVRQMIAIEPHDPATLGLAALISQRLGQRGQTVKFLKAQGRALDKSPTRPQSYHGLAGLWREVGDPTRAMDALAKSVRLWPDDARSHILLAEALKDAGQFDDAEAEARKAIELDPASDDAWAILAISLHRLAKFDDAAAAYEKSRELGRDVSVFHNWGAALVAAGRAGEAVRVCDEWLKHQPGNVEALALKGHALQEDGNVDEARILFDFDHYVRAHHIAAPKTYG